MLVADQLRSSAAAIRAEFGLTLFGFDVIIPSEPLSQCTTEDHTISASDGNSKGVRASGAMAVTVIDVNYFPSYKEVPDFPSRLRRYLASRKQQQEGGTGSASSTSTTAGAAADSQSDATAT